MASICWGKKSWVFLKGFIAIQIHTKNEGERLWVKVLLLIIRNIVTKNQLFNRFWCIVFELVNFCIKAGSNEVILLNFPINNFKVQFILWFSTFPDVTGKKFVRNKLVFPHYEEKNRIELIITSQRRGGLVPLIIFILRFETTISLLLTKLGSSPLHFCPSIWRSVSS